MIPEIGFKLSSGFNGADLWVDQIPKTPF